jgi:hypothetical protein
MSTSPDDTSTETDDERTDRRRALAEMATIDDLAAQPVYLDRYRRVYGSDPWEDYSDLPAPEGSS